MEKQKLAAIAARVDELVKVSQNLAGYKTYQDSELDGRLVREYLDGHREFIAYPAPAFECVVLGPAPATTSDDQGRQ